MTDRQIKGILGTKLGMTQVFDENNRVVPVTVVQAGPNVVTQVRTPPVDPANEHIFHQYTLRAERRDELQAHLKKEGIGHAVYYPMPLHRQPCFAHLGSRDGSMPQSERAAREVISLPIYPELTRPQLDRVIDAIRGFYR